jgi:two-component system chemotaxis sensor kinase CheA
VTAAESNVNKEFFAQFLDDYFSECDEHLTVVRGALLAIESFVGQPRLDRELIDKLFRSFHTLKGISGMVGVHEAERLAHHMESLLRALREGQLILSPDGMDGLVEGTRAMEQVIVARRVEDPPPDISRALSRLEALISSVPQSDRPSAEEATVSTAPGREGTRLWRFEFTPSSSLSERGVNVNSIRSRLQGIGEIVRALPLVSAEGGVTFEFIVASAAGENDFTPWRDDGLTFAPSGMSGPAAPVPATDEGLSVASQLPALAPSNVVRVDLARLDELMRMVGELVISRSHLDDNLKRVENILPPAEWQALEENNLAFERQLRYMREGVMRVRMVPIGEVFERMHFVVRDLAREYQKTVRLELAGQRTEIDKLLVERLMEPLLHLVRNAISHGLEPESERVARGKPPEGVIALRASTAGEMIVIEVEDDGRGIDSEQVARRAREKELIAADAIDDQSRLLEIICEPAFSTREEADRASGRGVGMSVVRDTVVELGGTLALDTRIGRGTRFTIQLPLTLAITDVLIVDAGGQKYAVPQSSVREVIEIDPASVIALENNEVVRYRGSVLPILRLARLFGLNERSGRALYALVAVGQDPVAIVVDRLSGQREIVVRTFTDPLIRIAGITGATELGDGRVVLILDLPSLARAARHNRGDAAIQAENKTADEQG